MWFLSAVLPATLQLLHAPWQETTPDAPGLIALRSVVRVAIGILILVLLTYIVIEQVGSRRRRRTGRD